MISETDGQAFLRTTIALSPALDTYLSLSISMTTLLPEQCSRALLWNPGAVAVSSLPSRMIVVSVPSSLYSIPRAFPGIRAHLRYPM